jgi:hypothetical protein
MKQAQAQVQVQVQVQVQAQAQEVLGPAAQTNCSSFVPTLDLVYQVRRSETQLKVVCSECFRPSWENGFQTVEFPAILSKSTTTCAYGP